MRRNVYIWQVLDGEDWKPIYRGAEADEPLMCYDEHTAYMLGEHAVAHHRLTGLPVRCVTFSVPRIIWEVCDPEPRP